MFEPLEKFGVDHIFGTLIRIEEDGPIKKVITEDGVLETKSIILAMGAKHRLLGVPGEDTTIAVVFHTVQCVTVLSLGVKNSWLSEVAILR